MSKQGLSRAASNFGQEKSIKGKATNRITVVKMRSNESFVDFS